MHDMHAQVRNGHLVIWPMTLRAGRFALEWRLLTRRLVRRHAWTRSTMVTFRSHRSRMLLRAVGCLGLALLTFAWITSSWRFVIVRVTNELLEQIDLPVSVAGRSTRTGVVQPGHSVVMSFLVSGADSELRVGSFESCGYVGKPSSYHEVRVVPGPARVEHRSGIWLFPRP